MKYFQMVFSPTGGTLKIAKIIMSDLSSSTETIDLSSPTEDFSKYSFSADDIVLIAVPSFGGRVPSLAVSRLAKVKGNGARCILLCVYGNRAYEDTLIELYDTASGCGFSVVAAVSAIAEHSIMHQYASGRPDKQDEMKLKSFSQKILQKLEKPSDPPKIPGNKPYKKAGAAGLVPKTNKECIDCGLCAKQCPANAINRADVRKVDSKKCISCMRCVAKCPRSAKTVNGVMVAAASLAIKKACSLRKECELFI